MSFKVSVIIEKDEAGYYAYAPELEGCQSQGDTLDEVMANIREATSLYWETLDENEKQELRNQEILTTSVEVGVG